MTIFQLLTVVVSTVALGISGFSLWRQRYVGNRDDRARAHEELDQAFFAFTQRHHGDPVAWVRFVAHLERAEIYAPNDARLARYKGFKAEESGDMAEAQRQFKIASRKPAHRGRALLDLARVSTGDAKERYLLEAKAEPLWQVNAMLSLAQIRIEAGDLRGAEVELDRVEELEPNRSMLHRWRAELALKRGDWGLAERCLEFAVEHATDAEVGDALVRLGSFLIQDHPPGGVRWQRAVDIVEKASAFMAPRDDYAHQMLAAIYADAAVATVGDEQLKWARMANLRNQQALGIDPRRLIPSDLQFERFDAIEAMLKGRDDDVD